VSVTARHRTGVSSLTQLAVQQAVPHTPQPHVHGLTSIATRPCASLSLPPSPPSPLLRHFTAMDDDPDTKLLAAIEGEDLAAMSMALLAGADPNLRFD